MLLAPVVKGRRGAHRDAIEAIQKAGLVRARVDGTIYPLEEIPQFAPQKTHDIEAVVDRLIIRDGVDTRLSESVRLAVKQGDGVVIILHQSPEAKSTDQWQERILNTRYACPRCGASIAEIEPRTFSFNSPYGACPACQGLGITVAAGGPPAAETTGDPPVTTICPACHGARLRPEARAVKLNHLALHEFTALTAPAALEFLQRLQFNSEQQQIATPLVNEITRRLEFLIQVGADYLTLDRPADTLSGGERQRVRLATGIGSGLVGVTYLLDEPSIGLHPRDNDRLIAALRNLQQQGNTVIVVEHDEAFLRASDYLIDIGPGAGPRGGQIIAVGPPEEVAKNENSLAGKYLSGKKQIRTPSQRRLPPAISQVPSITLSGARAHNLQNLTVTIPLHAFVCVTGTSGSGKSSLILDTLAPALARLLQERRRRDGRGRMGEGKRRKRPNIQSPPLPLSACPPLLPFTASFKSTAAPSAAPPAVTPPPTPASGTTSAASSPRPNSRASGDTAPAASALVARAAAAKSAKAPASNASP